MAKKTLSFVLFPKTEGTGPFPEGIASEIDLGDAIKDGSIVTAKWHNFSGELTGEFRFQNGDDTQKRNPGPGEGSSGNFTKNGKCIYSNITSSKLKYDPPIQFDLAWEE